MGDIPNLVMAGEFEPVTPPAFAEAVHANLRNSTYVLLENASHGAAREGCGKEMARGFFDNPEGNVSTSCLTDTSGIEWFSENRSAPSTKRVTEKPLGFKTSALTDRGVQRLAERFAKLHR